MRGYRRPASLRPVGQTIALPGRLYGVRTWRFSFDGAGNVRLGDQPDKLWRRGGETTWARCARGGHVAQLTPRGPCSCGLYALHPDNAEDSHFLDLPKPLAASALVGVVEAWGRIHVHLEGFRAQYARPTLFARIGIPANSEWGRLVEDVAIGHRAQVGDFGTISELLEHCRTGGLGMDARTVQALISDRTCDGVRADGLAT